MRARNIKPGFFLNEDLADIEPPWGRLAFAGLWCLADREGRLEDRPRRIKAAIFPYDDKMPGIEKILGQLSAKGFIIRYKVGGDKYIQISKFKDHQSPHNTERASTLPSLDINGELTVDSPLDNGGNPPDSLIHGFTDSLIEDSSNNARSGKPSAQAPLFFSCSYFSVDSVYREKLLTEYPLLDDKRLIHELSKMEDWLSDNRGRKKFGANGKMKNPKLFIKNWLDKLNISPEMPDKVNEPKGYAGIRDFLREG